MTLFAKANERARRFWTADLPPLGGTMRALCYGGLLAFSLWYENSPLGAVIKYEQTDPLIATPSGVAAWLDFAGLGLGGLQALRGVVIGAWFCCVIGLFGIFARLVTGLGVLYLHGVLVGFNSHSHNWYLAAYTLVALIFAAHRAPSVDGWLQRRWSWWRPEPDIPLFRTGFARQLVLVFAVYTLFASFVSKMMFSGPAWADGSTIGWMVNLQGSKWQWPVDVMNAHAWTLPVLGIATLLLEAGIVAALFSDRLRLPLFAMAAGFHVGIFLVMLPNFLSQVICYLLVVNWGAAWRRLLRKQLEPARPPDTSSAGHGAPWPLALSGGILFISAGVVATGTELWPASNLPVYEYHAGSEMPALTSGRLRDTDHLREMVRHAPRGSHCLWSRSWLSMVFKGPGVDDLPVEYAYRAHYASGRTRWEDGGEAERSTLRYTLGDPSQARKRRRLAMRQAVLDSAAGALESGPVRAALEPLLPWLCRIAPDGYTQVELVAGLEQPGDLTLITLDLDRP